MKTYWRRKLSSIGMAAMAVLAFSSISRAQMNQTAGPNLGAAAGEAQERMELSNMYALGDKDQVAAYKAFSKEPHADKKIELGSRFLQKYPKSPYTERVDAGLMNAYHAQQDWKNTYLFADSALALQPDDVDVLTTVAWTIPHVYTPDDTGADQELDKAETYAKHAIDVLAKMPKPPDLNDVQFTASKSKRSLQAHSALGLVYFRRQDYDGSAKELAQSTKGNSVPDPTDLFVLGTDLENLQRYRDAAEAFRECGQIAGVFESQCKQKADFAKAQADVSNTK
jgi:tetratricopeptide (TPR) repeat protein